MLGALSEGGGEEGPRCLLWSLSSFRRFVIRNLQGICPPLLLPSLQVEARWHRRLVRHPQYKVLGSCRLPLLPRSLRTQQAERNKPRPRMPHLPLQLPVHQRFLLQKRLSPARSLPAAAENDLVFIKHVDNREQKKILLCACQQSDQRHAQLLAWRERDRETTQAQALSPTSTVTTTFFWNFCNCSSSSGFVCHYFTRFCQMAVFFVLALANKSA
mmetsp:Transcript_53359/g.91752  ORF Transcript_53359/g.91752 Transcript_53359/m.91752 type:complete len:215 (+) Transcript_53359:3-647(+)